MLYRLRNWVQDEEGMATVEYAMLLALVVVATIGAWMGLGARLRTAIATATATISEPLG
jgi:Flp pilus assembly pilin Flp